MKKLSEAMMKIDRILYAEDPNVITLKNAKVSWDGQGKFSWKVIINGRGFDISKKIKPILLEMTSKHCAFCDLFPLSSDFFDPSIEHFEPKSKAPDKAYQWENLFPSCNGCTSTKKEKFDKNLLKPDEDSYSFEIYFSVTGDGKLVPSIFADEASMIKAKTTIDIYQLNRSGLLTLRKQAIEDYIKLIPIRDIDNRKFRFLIPIAEKVKNPDEIINDIIQ